MGRERITIKMIVDGKKLPLIWFICEGRLTTEMIVAGKKVTTKMHVVIKVADDEWVANDCRDVWGSKQQTKGQTQWETPFDNTTKQTLVWVLIFLFETR